MIPQRTGPQLDLASGNLKALVVQAGAVSAVTHWLPSTSAVFCRMCLLTRSHISRHSPQHESSMFNPLSWYQNLPLCFLAMSNISPLSLLRCSWLERAVVLGKHDILLLVWRHLESPVVSGVPQR